jgi:class 3 adenylate cyclase
VSSPTVEHRFAVIMCADVVGYSRLMGADEEGTLAALNAVRRDLVDPTIAAHRGRIVNLGEHEVRNVARPVRVFRIARDRAAAASAPGLRGRPAAPDALIRALAGVAVLPI